MWLIYLIQNIMHKGISYHVSGLFFIAVVGQGKMKCQSGVFWAIGNYKGVVSLCPHSLLKPLILKSSKEITAHIRQPPSGFHSEKSLKQRKPHFVLWDFFIDFCYFQKISGNFLCPPSGMNSPLSKSSLLTCVRGLEFGSLPYSFINYED